MFRQTTEGFSKKKKKKKDSVEPQSYHKTMYTQLIHASTNCWWIDFYKEDEIIVALHYIRTVLKSKFSMLTT